MSRPWDRPRGAWVTTQPIEDSPAPSVLKVVGVMALFALCVFCVVMTDLSFPDTIEGRLARVEARTRWLMAA